MDDIKHDVAHGVDPRAWMQVAPWTTLASATIAGFLAAAAAVPSKEQQALKRLRKLEDALRPEGDGDVRSSTRNAANAAAKERKPSFLAQIFQVLQPVITSALSGAVAAKTADSPANGHDSNGDPNVTP